MDSRKQVNHYHMEYQACSVSYNNSGSHFLVGCRNGKTLIFEEDQKDAENQHLTPLKNPLAGDRYKEIIEIKFSPNDKYLAVGGMDSRIFLYNGKTWEYLRTLKGHHSTINYIDFSVDGKYLQSSDSNCFLLYWDVEQGNQ